MRLLLLFVACVTVPPAPMPAGAIPIGKLARIYRVEDGIYRSPQPTAEDFREIVRQLGIKTVIKLNSRIEGHDDLPAGVELFHDPWLPAGPVTHEQIVDALEDLARAPRPVLIHCSHGVDRTGLLVALWRVKHGSLAFAAWNEWRAFGRDENLILLSDAFKRETGWSP